MVIHIMVFCFSKITIWPFFNWKFKHFHPFSQQCSITMLTVTTKIDSTIFFVQLWAFHIGCNEHHMIFMRWQYVSHRIPINFFSSLFRSLILSYWIIVIRTGILIYIAWECKTICAVVEKCNTFKTFRISYATFGVLHLTFAV